MKCPNCGEFDVDGLTPHESAHGTTWHDDKGVIRHRDQTSEQASKVSKSRAFSKAQKQTADELAQAAIDVLVDESDPRADGLKILITQLSKSASKDASNALKAIELMLGLFGETAKTPRKPAIDEPCSICGRREPVHLALDKGPAQRVLDLLFKDERYKILDLAEYEELIGRDG